MDKKVYFHIGLAKTATSFLQRYIFPKSSFCYLGKYSISHSRHITKDAPWDYMKFLQLGEPGVASNILKDRQKNFPIVLDKYSHYLDIISRHSTFLISDECLTASPLMHHINWLHPFILERVKSSNKEWKNCFEAGVGLADSIWHGSDKQMANLRANLLQGDGSNPVTFRLTRIMEMFELSLGRILLVNRDIGSWFVSFFLQSAAGAKTRKSWLAAVIRLGRLFGKVG